MDPTLNVYFRSLGIGMAPRAKFDDRLYILLFILRIHMLTTIINCCKVLRLCISHGTMWPLAVVAKLTTSTLAMTTSY